ncbi:hypothetical protein BDY24DRAFT_417240 [Mrakia frigida]|uniref:uncharacterized protein n=1 Tax=Mrakia frigida TaxID=29902 RepID=UPI003FCC09B0
MSAEEEALLEDLIAIDDRLLALCAELEALEDEEDDSDDEEEQNESLTIDKVTNRVVNEFYKKAIEV